MEGQGSIQLNSNLFSQKKTPLSTKKPEMARLLYNKKLLGLCLLGDRYFCNVITLIIIMVWLSGRARFLSVDSLSGQKS